MQNCFVPADILLPGAATPLDPWACIAVDQFTSQPEYWQKAEELAKGKPSTLHIVLPEAYLGTPQEESRLAAIRAAMQDYRDNLLTRCVHGYVYVERTQMDGTIRQGLVGAVDLEQYSFKKGSKPAIRPSESTVVARIPPRLPTTRLTRAANIRKRNTTASTTAWPESSAGGTAVILCIPSGWASARAHTAMSSCRSIWMTMKRASGTMGSTTR